MGEDWNQDGILFDLVRGSFFFDATGEAALLALRILAELSMSRMHVLKDALVQLVRSEESKED